MALSALACLACTTAALAEQTGEPDNPFVEAGERFRHGVQLFEQERYEASLVEFQRARELAPHPQVTFNIARIHARLDHVAEAIDGYERYLVEAGDGVPAELRLEVETEIERLRRLVGALRVVVERPSDGAVVYLDGREIGPAPLAAPLRVRTGSHAVEVRAEGFLTFSREVAVVSEAEVVVGASLIRAASPDHATGAIVVETGVPGVAVSLDGEPVGSTPLERPIVALVGAHAVRLSRPGYLDEERRVEVALAQETRLEVRLRVDEAALTERGASVEVTPSEPGAEVVLDGEPYAGGPVPPGPHLIEVSRPGFDPWTRLVDLERGEARRLEADLRPTEATRSRYEERAARYRLAAWSLATAALATVGLAAGLYGWNAGRDRDWSGELADLYATPEAELTGEDLRRAGRLEADLEGLSAWSATEWGLLGLGLAAAGLALTLFLVGPDPDRYERLDARVGPFWYAMIW